MRKFYFTLSFILITTFSYSQKDRGFSLGLNYSPNYDNFLFVGKSKEFFNDIRHFKKPHWGYTYGLTLKYMFNKRVGLETGALLTKKGSTLESKDSFLYTENYFSTEIPLKFSYKIIDARLSCSINMGVNFSFTNRFRGYVEFLGIKEEGTSALDFRGARYIDFRPEPFTQTELDFKSMSEKNYRNFNLIPSASLAFSYRLTDKISIGLEPTFRFSLMNQASKKYETFTRTSIPYKLELTADTSQIFWNVGLNSTIYYNF